MSSLYLQKHEFAKRVKKVAQSKINDEMHSQLKRVMHLCREAYKKEGL